MADYIQETFLRIKAMQKEAVASLKPDLDVEFWPHQQEGPWPYMTNRLGPMNADFKTYSEDIDVEIHTVLMRLVSGHITEGQISGIQDEVHAYIVLLENYFRTHPLLTTDAGTYADDGGPAYLLYGADVFLS